MIVIYLLFIFSIWLLIFFRFWKKMFVLWCNEVHLFWQAEINYWCLGLSSCECYLVDFQDWLIFKIDFRIVKRKILNVYFYFVFLNPGFTPHSKLLLLLLFLFLSLIKTAKNFFCFIKFLNIVTFVYDFQKILIN